MKTDIFKDLVPLVNMSYEQINDLAKSIAEENKEEADRLKLKTLLLRTNDLYHLIMAKI